MAAPGERGRARGGGGGGGEGRCPARGRAVSAPPLRDGGGGDNGPGDGGNGSDLDCADFGSQSEAQAVFDADPTDPNDLATDDAGLACQTLDSADRRRPP